MRNNNDSAEMSNQKVDAQDESKNLIALNDDMYPEAKEGEMVTAQVEGVIKNKEDGSRCIYVQKLDGKEVGMGEPKEEEMSDEALEQEITNFAKENTGTKSYK